MKNARTRALIGLTMGLAAAGSAHGSCPLPPTITVSGFIGSQTWTPANVYALDGQVYLTPGATLTIEAGTIVASDPADQGSLAVPRGAQLVINGTQQDPVIFTSTADVATWTDCDPKTGTWRESALEWGNITLMGNAYISKGTLAPGTIPGNTDTCGPNVADMEGLTNGPATDRYGGTDDNDDSGSISYLSIRYGGKVVALTNELNGLSLGGIGRATDIDHVEIMNNVDDGIEIWGGTVNIKHFNIWNIGDDSFDCDQGWRGKAQFGLIVQGWSLDAPQGSGVGDNCFETDGAENSNAQPLTTATIYNTTVIGQPADGDGGTAWRDGARVQYRNCIFMDLGEKLVRFDNIDGDGGLGYGGVDCNAVPAFANSTFADIWTTPFTVTEALNSCGSPGTIYQSQSAGGGPGQGFLAEITDSVFFRNLNSAYTGTGGGASTPGGADDVGVTSAGGSNPAKGNVVAGFVLADPDANMPIQSLTRGAPVVRGGKTMVQVISLDPRPANAALTSMATAPADGFFCPAGYRGAFAPNENWLLGWTAADAYGFVVPPPCAEDLSGNADVDFADILAVIGSWGPCTGPCPCLEDLSGNGDVDFADILAVIGSWGPCP